MKPTVYILQSKNKRFYIGSTSDLTRRLKEHVEGHSKYTRDNLPVELVYHQEYPTLKEARRIEYKLKRLKRRDIIEQIIRDQKIRLGL